MYSLIAPSTRNIVLPPDAGPGQARIVIGPDLPPPLDTYISGDGPLVGGIIFYGTGDDSTFNFIVTVDDSTPATAIELQGTVISGAVVEWTPTRPVGLSTRADVLGQTTELSGSRVDAISTGAMLFTSFNGLLQILAQNGNVSLGSSNGRVNIDSNQDDILLQAFFGSIVATSDVDATLTAFEDVSIESLSQDVGIVSAIGDIGLTAGDDITIDAASDVIIDGAATVDLRTNGTTTSRLLLDSTGVTITAAGAGDDVSVIAADDINITATDDVIISASDTIVAGPLHWRTGTGGADATQETNRQTGLLQTTSTSYALTGNVTAGTACGVAFVAPPSGKVLINWSVAFDNSTAAGIAFCCAEVRQGSVVGSGTVTVGTDDNDAAIMTNTDVNRTSSHLPVSGLTPGTTYNVSLWQKSSAGANTASFTSRRVTVTPSL